MLQKSTNMKKTFDKNILSKIFNYESYYKYIPMLTKEILISDKVIVHGIFSFPLIITLLVRFAGSYKREQSYLNFFI